MYRLALVMTVVALVFGARSVAAQQPACTERSDVLDHLNSQYSEAPVAMGLANNGGVIEILSSLDHHPDHAQRHDLHDRGRGKLGIPASSDPGRPRRLI